MIIEFELQGSKCLHKGLFDSTGLWVRYERDEEMVPPVYDEHGTMVSDGRIIVDGWKIYSHGSFAFYHTDKAIVDEVFVNLARGLGRDRFFEYIIDGVGYIRRC